MQPIKLYFAGEWGPRSSQGDLGITNRLVSYLYPNQFSKWLETSKNKKGNIILDSGAFSAWNRGRNINLSDYITFAREAVILAENNQKHIRIVNLDVIPGKVGETKRLNVTITDSISLENNSKLIDDCAKRGFLNLKIMKSEGITPIHVFHQGEHLRWFDRMLKYTDYVGISPANDMPNNSRQKWIDSVFTYIYKNNIDVKTHGFAVMVPEILREYPWTSCDAISWLMIAATGCVLYPIGGFKQQPISTSKEKPFNQILVSEKKIAKNVGHLTDKLLMLFEQDGYSYQQLQDYKIREEINVKTYLFFEKWLNQYKKEHEYKPPHRLNLI